MIQPTPVPKGGGFVASALLTAHGRVLNRCFTIVAWQTVCNLFINDGNLLHANLNYQYFIVPSGPRVATKHRLWGGRQTELIRMSINRLARVDRPHQTTGLHTAKREARSAPPEVGLVLRTFINDQQHKPTQI